MSTSRQPLSRPRIAAAALEFIDTNGEAALSMRKLGAELGVEAMSLYNHVASKDDLLDAVGELLYTEILSAFTPLPEWTWQQDLRELAVVYRAAAHTHRNAFSIMADRPLPSTVKYVFLEKCYRIFTKAGFDTKQAALAFDTGASWVVGSIHQEFGVNEGLPEVVPRDQLPAELVHVADFSEACAAWTPEQRFDFGLNTVIAGLEAQLRA